MGVLVTSSSRSAESGASGVRGERTEEPDEVQERAESMEVRMPAERFLRGEVDPKMALVAMLARTTCSKAFCSCEMWPCVVEETEMSDSALEHQLSRE